MDNKNTTMHLALNGGRAVAELPFPGYPLIGDEKEVNAVSEVVPSGKLSMFDLAFSWPVKRSGHLKRILPV